MKTWLFALVPLMGGCIIYDTTGKLDGDRPGEHDPADDTGNVVDDTGAPGDDTGEPTGTKLYASPDAVEVNSTGIVHVTADGAFDFSRVVDVQVFGAGRLTAHEVATGEVLLALDFADTGVPLPATVDVVLTTADGQAIFGDDLITVYPVGQVPPEDDGDPSNDTGTDTGSGGDDTGPC